MFVNHIRKKTNTALKSCSCGIIAEPLKVVEHKFHLGHFQQFYGNSTGSSCSKLTKALVMLIKILNINI